MRDVLWLTTHYPPAEVGGSAESVALVAVAMPEVRVVTPDWTGVGDSPGVRRFRVVPHEGMPSERRFLSPLFLLRAAAAGVRAGRGAAVVHAQDRRMIWPAFLASRVLGVPAVLTLRDVGLLCPVVVCLMGRETPSGSPPPSCGQRQLWQTCAPRFFELTGAVRWRYPMPRRERRRMRQWKRPKLAARFAWLRMEQRLVRRFAAVAFVSHGVASAYAKVADGLRTWVLPTPMPEPKWVEAAGQRPPSWLFTGKQSPGKGWDMVQYARSVLGGHGVFEPTATVETMQGHSRQAVWEAMQRSVGVLVPPLQQDALPRIALEALARSRPVVGTWVGGLPEVVPWEWLVSPGALEEFVECLRAVQADPEQGARRAFGIAQCLWTRHAPSACAEAHRRLYAEVAGSC